MVHNKLQKDRRNKKKRYKVLPTHRAGESDLVWKLAGSSLMK